MKETTAPPPHAPSLVDGVNTALAMNTPPRDIDIDSELISAYPETLDSSADYNKGRPKPSEHCLYGQIGDMAKMITANSEANTYIVALHLMEFLGASIGNAVYRYKDNDKHHPRFFVLHVGGSSIGRKGTAWGAIYRVREVMANIKPESPVRIIRGGLSSGEGIALLAHDGFSNGGEEIPAIEDKRVLIIESEFASVINHSRRTGNTLADVLRNIWDGKPIAPITKSAPIECKEPAFGISGQITPYELRDIISNKDIFNGFLNRFIIIFAEREKIVPLADELPDTTLNMIANVLLEVIAFVENSGKNIKVNYSAEAQEYYISRYKEELSSGGEVIEALTARAFNNAERLAMLYAVIDSATTTNGHPINDDGALLISKDHIQAGFAWADYHRQSVEFIFKTGKEEAEQEEVINNANKIYDYLKAHGTSKTRTEISKDCFSGNLSANKLDDTLNHLLGSSPPKVELITDRTGKGRPTKRYKLINS